jgi:hypothetical protein
MGTNIHLQNIDFRTREQRSKEAIDDFKQWYRDLHVQVCLKPDERLEGQLTMLSAVLWYLLPASEYKAFMKISKVESEYQERLGLDLRDIE